MKPPPPSKEQLLLFNILKGDLPTSLDGIDTEILFDLFRRHRLFPLAPPLLPLLGKEERDRWKKAIQFRTLRSMHHLAILGELINVFNEAGIEAIPIKGPVLSQQLFGNLGARHFSDLDVLVRGIEFQQLIMHVEKLGFSLKIPNPGISTKQWRYFSKHKRNISLHNQELEVKLELHQSIENHVVLKPTDVAHFLKKMEIVEIGGVSFSFMNKEYTFLYLTLHGGVHQFRRLFWLRDIAEALNNWDIEHQMVLKTAQSMGVEHILGVSLLLSEEFFHAEIPSDYSDYLKNNHKLHQKLFVSATRMINGPEFPGLIGKLNRFIYMLRFKPSIYYKRRVISEGIHRLIIGRFME